MMKSKKTYFYIIIRNSIQYFSKSHFWGVLEQSIAVFRAFLAMFEIIATKKLFDNVTNSSSFDQIAYSILILTMIVILRQIINGIGQYLFNKVSYTNMGKFMVDFQKKLARLPAIYFEDPKFLDNLEKSKECLEYENLGHFASICLQTITYYLVYLILMCKYLYKVSPILIMVLFLGFIPALINQIIRAKYFVNLEEILAPERRRCDSYKKSIVDIHFYKETRMLGAYNYFYNLFVDSLFLLTDKRWKLEKKLSFYEVLLDILTFIGLGISIYILFLQLISRKISIGMFVAIFTSLSDIFSIMNELISSHFGNLSEVFAQALNFYNIMDMKEVDVNNNYKDFSKGIILDNVYFKYPGTDNYAISNISLQIKPNETVAIVGENGSGKTTLVKILAGLYLPTDGSVRIGDDIIYNGSNKINYNNISAVFQNFQKYKLTLKENVYISDIKDKGNIRKIKNSLTKTEFKNENANLNTILSPEFGGIDLSLGQRQRLAIARSIFRKNKFIILDEPTASIDPLEESKLYQQFGEIVKNKSAIIVTHRLGSVKFADRIIVIEKGKIIESGTHDQLIEKRGKYYSMWKLQSKWYEN